MCVRVQVCKCVRVRHVYVELGSRVSILDTDRVLRPRACGVGLRVSLPASDLVLCLQERFVVHITDVLAVSMMLGITAQVKEAGIAWDKGEKRSKDAGVARPCSVGGLRSRLVAGGSLWLHCPLTAQEERSHSTATQGHRAWKLPSRFLSIQTSPQLQDQALFSLSVLCVLQLWPSVGTLQAWWPQLWVGGEGKWCLGQSGCLIVGLQEDWAAEALSAIDWSESLETRGFRSPTCVSGLLHAPWGVIPARNGPEAGGALSYPLPSASLELEP